MIGGRMNNENPEARLEPCQTSMRKLFLKKIINVWQGSKHALKSLAPVVLYIYFHLVEICQYLLTTLSKFRDFLKNYSILLNWLLSRSEWLHTKITEGTIQLWKVLEWMLNASVNNLGSKFSFLKR